MKTAQHWINQLNLKPHPEGGFYAETYRSQAGTDTAAGPRSCCTGIYFLLRGCDVSRFHRIASDEMWHFYDGSPLTVHQIGPDGEYATHVLGLDSGQPQCVVPAGCWFGATVNSPDGFTLVGCTVAPGFDFADFQLADRQELLAHFPQHTEIITQLT
jgi:predicted cupin superfamily sugar epimerase